MINNPQTEVNFQQIFSAFPEVILAYLFGSQVNGSIGPLSDYDFGILVENVKNGEIFQARLTHILRKELETERIDVVMLNHIQVEMAFSIISQGICIFSRATVDRVEYEANIMSRYGDYLPVLRSFKEDILRGEGYDRRVQRYREALGRTERTLSQVNTSQH